MSRAEYEHFLNFIFHILRPTEGKEKPSRKERVSEGQAFPHGEGGSP